MVAISGIGNIDKTNLRSEIASWAKRNIVDKQYASIALRRFVIISKNSIDHVLAKFYQNNEVRIRMLKILPSLISTAHFLYKEENLKIEKKPNLKQVHNLFNTVLFENTNYAVWIKVYEYNDGRFILADYGIQ
jgi:hypothetical protein